jgi:hypothetical protein
MAYDRNNVFARILRGELPCTKVYEDEHVLAFRDINPQAPTHIVVIPKGEYVSVDDFPKKPQSPSWPLSCARSAGSRITKGRRNRLPHPRQPWRGGASGRAAFSPSLVRRPRPRPDAAPAPLTGRGAPVATGIPSRFSHQSLRSLRHKTPPAIWEKFS